jgi:predicted DNA-binding transcriptional regulator AlpA
MNDRQSLATPAEVGAYLRREVKTLRNWRHRGTGPKFCKVGHAVMYRWSDVDAWLEAQTRSATRAA